MDLKLCARPTHRNTHTSAGTHNIDKPHSTSLKGLGHFFRSLFFSHCSPFVFIQVFTHARPVREVACAICLEEFDENATCVRISFYTCSFSFCFFYYCSVFCRRSQFVGTSFILVASTAGCASEMPALSVGPFVMRAHAYLLGSGMLVLCVGLSVIRA